jgi:hypothetical protein
MLAECCMDYAAVEQNLGRVGNLVKDLQCDIELVVVIAGEGCHPGFDFLPRGLAIALGKSGWVQEEGAHLLQRHDE